MNRHTVDLGFIRSRAEVTAVFTNVDKWIMAVFVNGLGIKRKIEKIGKEQLKTHAKNQWPSPTKKVRVQRNMNKFEFTCVRTCTCMRICMCTCMCMCMCLPMFPQKLFNHKWCI